MDDFRAFVQWAKLQKQESVEVRNSPLQSVIAANGALLLLDTTCFLLDRQIARLAADFEKEGVFSERMYNRRTEKKQEQK